MPVTPLFNLSQDDRFVILEVRVPFVRVSNETLDYCIDECSVSLHVKPYLLRLTLPHPVVDDEHALASFDPVKNNGTVTLKLPKVTPNLHFEDLDMLTKLLQPRSTRASPAQSDESKKLDIVKERKMLEELISGDGNESKSQRLNSGRLVEVVSSHCFDGDQNAVEDNVNRSGDIEESGNDGNFEKSFEDYSNLFADSLIEEVLEIADDEDAFVPESIKYGFASLMSNFFADLRCDFPELVQLPDPEKIPRVRRRRLRVETENLDFDESRYLGDTLDGAEDPIYQAAMKYTDHLPKQSEICFSEKEQGQLMNLTNREFLPLSRMELREVLCSILDVLIGYSYDQRTTEGDDTVESGWTIKILSSTLSWLDVFQNPKIVLISGMRRMLTYPYLRNLELAFAVLEDAVAIVSGGRRSILRALLRIHFIMSRSDQNYLLNSLYITDMCVWIQQVDNSVIDMFIDCSKRRLDELLSEDPSAWIGFPTQFERQKESIP